MEKFKLKVELSSKELVELFSFVSGVTITPSDHPMHTMAEKVKKACDNIATEDIKDYVLEVVVAMSQAMDESPNTLNELEEGLTDLVDRGADKMDKGDTFNQFNPKE